MKRIYHPYNKWEETTAGMWRNVSSFERESYKIKSAELMKDLESFYAAMRRVIVEWTNSCEQNLTDSSLNRLAWMGHAACCIQLGSPEDATRAGWWLLTEDEQDNANEAASIVIQEWKGKKCQNVNLEFQF